MDYYALENEDIVKNYGVPVDEDGTPFSITSWRQGPKGPLVKFKNIPTREDAEEFRGTALFVPREEFPELEEDELYYSDLEGMTVLNHKGDKIGKVGSVFSNGAQDVFTVFGIPSGRHSLRATFAVRLSPPVLRGAEQDIRTAHPPQCRVFFVFCTHTPTGLRWQNRFVSEGFRWAFAVLRIKSRTVNS